MLCSKDGKKIAIYSFYDKDGIVDRYVEYFLEHFTKCVDRLLIVSNGKLPDDQKAKLSKFTGEIIERENEGFDIWGYKTGMDAVGWNELQKYEELITLNNTIMGPVSPLNQVFEKMDKKDLDFWGMTRHYQFDYDWTGRNPWGCIPEHIQSYFLIFRKTLIESKCFQDYWDNLPMLHDYQEAVGYHESAFTRRFEEKGYKWDTFVVTDDMENLTPTPLMDYARLLIEERGMPVFKKRMFFQDYSTMLNSTTGQAAVELYDYLNEKTDYDVDMIWETILRSCHQSDYQKTLGLNYILSSEKVDESAEEYQTLREHKIALFMHLYFDDLADQSLRYASAMPEFADIYITTNTEEKKKIFEEKFGVLHCHKLEIRVVPNRGRDVSSLLVSLRDVVPQYEIACFYHDKKSGQAKPGSIGDSFGYKCAENVLYNKNFVLRVLKAFIEHPRLGILAPPEPNHGPYFNTLGHEWFDNYSITEELAHRLNINVPMSPEKAPVAPYGSVFWYRVKALSPLQDYPWTYEDFPEEPLPVDKTISHAIERIRPFAAQGAGYYSAFMMVDHYARIEFNNLRQYLINYTKFNEKNGFLMGTQQDNLRRAQDVLNQGAFAILANGNNSLTHKVMVVSRKIFPDNVYSKLIHVKRKLFGPHDLS